MSVMNLNTLGILTYKMINRHQVNDLHKKQYFIIVHFLKFKMLSKRNNLESQTLVAQSFSVFQ